MPTWSALWASTIVCATLQAQPPCFLPGLGADIPGLHSSLFLARKDLPELAFFFFWPHFLWYQLETFPSLWYQYHTVLHIWREWSGNSAVRHLNNFCLESQTDQPYLHWAMEVDYYCFFFFSPLVKNFHYLVIPGSPSAASDKQLCKNYSLAGGTASQRWISGHWAALLLFLFSYFYSYHWCL